MKCNRIVWPLTATLMATLLAAAAALAQSVFPVAPGPCMQLHPAVTCGQLDYYLSLVVWEDWRNPEAADIYCARMVPGFVYDTLGIPVSTAARNQLNPAVAKAQYLNAPFLVVWEDWRNGGPAIYGARVTDAGEVLDYDGFRISLGPNPAYRPAITTGQSDTSDYLVVWEDRDSDSTTRIAGTRVSWNGLVRDTTPIVLSRMPGRQVCPASARNTHAANFLTVWEQHSQLDDSVLLYAARVDYGGNVLDTIPVRVCTTASRQTEPAITSDDSNYLVMWQDDRRNSPAVYAAWLNAHLQCTGPSGVLVDSSQNSQRHPSVWWPWQDNWFLVCWEESDGESRSSVRIGWLSSNGFWPDGPTTDSLNLMTPECVDFYGNATFVASAVNAAPPGTPAIYRWPQGIVGQKEHISSPAASPLRVEPSIARDRCRVEWQTNHACSPTLQVLDVSGRVRKEFRCGALSPGRHQADLSLAGLSPGAYFVRLVGVGIPTIRRIVILR